MDILGGGVEGATPPKGGNSHWTSEMSDTNNQTAGNTETNNVKMSDYLPLCG